MQVKKWMIITKEQAELIVKYLNPVDILDNDEREQAHKLRRDLIQLIGDAEKQEIIYQVKKMWEGV